VGALPAGGFAPPLGAGVPDGAGVGAAGAGVSGTVLGTVVAGAVFAGRAPCSKTERGTPRPTVISDMRYAIPMKRPASHHVALVSRLAACRVPTNASVDEEVPPKLAAKPDPFPAWRRTTTTSSRLTRTSRTSRKVNIASRR